jgi:uncharacterized phage protein gp47/JayE
MSGSPPTIPPAPVYLSDPMRLPAGERSVFFAARSTAPGTESNAAARVFTHHNFTGYAAAPYGSLLVANDYGLTGGRDEETDDNLRYRIQLKIQSQSGANEAALRFELLQVPGIQDFVFDRHAGTFDVYVFGISPSISASLLDLIQQKIDRKVAFPLTGNALAPDLVGISLTTWIESMLPMAICR